MIPFTSFYGMRMNPFDKELPTRDAYLTLDMEWCGIKKVDNLFSRIS